MRFLATVICWLIAATPSWAANSIQRDTSTVTLVSKYTSIVPGQPIELGILMEPQAGWHSYWQNPGDAGLPTTLKWTLPEGFSAGDIQWDTPERVMEGPLATFAYSTTTLFPVDITSPTNLTDGVYHFQVTIDWLICKDICIPETAYLDIMLPVSATAQESPHAQYFAAHEERLPQLIKEAGSHTSLGENLILSLPRDQIQGNVQTADFFIRQPNLVYYDAPVRIATTNDAVQFSIKSKTDNTPDTISGILAINTNTDAGMFYDVSFNKTDDMVIATEPWLPALLLAALLGGLILNLMPCVLPVLSLKALTIAKKAGSERAEATRHGIAYTLGILLSFAAVAGILLALRNAGEAIGWGYQMQIPAFVGFMIYLLFMIGLNLSDKFHIPVLLGHVQITNSHSTRGSFLTGVLATAVATPCTAPFMAGAVGAALTLPAWQAMLVFETLGLGLALPFLLVSFFPALLRFLPKPGDWMNRLKKWLAWPMYASVLWLLWVLALQTGTKGVVVSILSMGILFYAVHVRKPVIATSLIAATLLVSLPALSQMEIKNKMMPSSQEMGIDIVPYSKDTLTSLRAEGKTIFVDATAAWCITCQLNARIAIHTERSMEAFRTNNVTLMVADWTLRNDDITDFLSSFGYKGVPLYVVYPANGTPPVVLPQLLTEDIVIKAITSDASAPAPSPAP